MTSAPDFIAELPSAVRADSVEVARQEITRVVAKREQYRSELDELQGQVNEMSAELGTATLGLKTMRYYSSHV